MKPKLNFLQKKMKTNKQDNLLYTYDKSLYWGADDYSVICFSV